MSQYYFAFASNLNPSQMEKRCPNAVYRTKAFLPKHRLAFTHPSQSMGGGSADILADAESLGVWGGIYEVSAEDLQQLDMAESKSYKRIKVTVFEGGLEDCPLECHAYKVVNPTGPHLPTQAYHEKIVTGAIARSLPAGWIACLKGLSFKA